MKLSNIKYVILNSLQDSACSTAELIFEHQ